MGFCGAATILVVDDDANLRELIVTLLRETAYHTVEAACGDSAVAVAERARPDLVVLDVDLPGLCGYEVCRRLRLRYGDELPIIFVSGVRTETFDRVAALMIGGDDYLAKPFAPDELVARVGALLRRADPEQSARRAALGLTRRELEILGLLADGLDQAEIAARLSISSKTVATHLEHVLAKLGVHSRAQAVAVAYRRRVLPTR